MNTLNTNNLKKIVVNYVVMIFTVTVILTIFFLIIYYFTPNNYNILDYESELFLLKKEKEIKILPNSLLRIKYNEYSNFYIKFDQDINLIIKNSFKSQSIIYSIDKIIQIRFYSDIIINNNTDLDMNLKIIYYDQKS